ncbi:MAG: ATP-binding cassette domain-containing protein [Trueperaceae bacterium]|nr:ATP-binding cassette domain-containing protein [Trueperaceae bacterium]
MSVASLVATDVTFGYDPAVPVVHDVSVHVGPGEVLFLLGHNGSGKTSLLSCLNGVQRPTRGRITLDGVDVQALDAARRARRIGMIPQVHVATFAYSVHDVVLMGRAPHLSTFAGPRAEDHAITRHALERVGLADLAQRPYTELSGGERQLVMVARGLAQQCDVLLMDEPDAHLDPRNQYRVLEVVSDLARQQGLSFVVSSHAPNSALMFADRVVLLRHGRVLASGGVEDTLSEDRLAQAYGMPTEVVTKVVNGRRVPRAILPRRIDRVPDDLEALALTPAALDRPGSALARLFDAAQTEPQRLIVTGARGAGKSRWCQALVARVRARGARVAGVSSPAVLREGHKVGIDLVDLATDTRRRLAALRRDDEGGQTTERWRFDDAVLAWGNEVLRAAAAARPDLLLVDELGPLEFHRSAGLTAGIDAVDGGAAGVACVVVRPSLLKAATARWPDAVIVDVED